MSDNTQKPMSKARRAIWDKSGGKCWYCGCELPERGWHADHMEPIGRLPPKTEFVYNQQGGVITRERIETPRLPSHPDRDNPDNLVPACQSCNTIKGMEDVEGFRATITKFVNSLNQYSVPYKFAKRYGLVQETQVPVTFWFETRGEAHP